MQPGKLQADSICDVEDNARVIPKVGANTLTFASVGYIEPEDFFSDAEGSDEVVTVKHPPGAIVAAATTATRAGIAAITKSSSEPRTPLRQ